MTKLADLDIKPADLEWLKVAAPDPDYRPTLHQLIPFKYDGQTWVGVTDSFRIHAIKHPPLDKPIPLDERGGGPVVDIAAVIPTETTLTLNGQGLDGINDHANQRYEPISGGLHLIDEHGEWCDTADHLYARQPRILKFYENGAALHLDSYASSELIAKWGTIGDGDPVAMFNPGFIAGLGGALRGNDSINPWVSTFRDRLVVLMPIRIKKEGDNA